MPAPKGMRAVNLLVNETDAVHVYSNTKQIWLQLRRQVATLQAIGQPSFKVALNLTPKLAMELAAELLTAAAQHQQSPGAPQPSEAKKAPASPAAPKAVPGKVAAPKPVTVKKPDAEPPAGKGAGGGAKFGKPWTETEVQELAARFEEGISITDLAEVHQRSVGGIEDRLLKLGKITPEEHSALRAGRNPVV